MAWNLLTVSWFTLVLTLWGATPSAVAQSGCLKGELINAIGLNGAIKLCPDSSARAPELQKQLNDIQAVLSGNQALLREVTHSARSVNDLGRDVGPDRQLQLLQSYGKQLQALVSSDQQRTQRQLSDLADKLDNLQQLVAQKKEDNKTEQQTKLALEGKLGDAIAALNLGEAEQQLNSIEAKVDIVVANTTATKQILERQDAQQRAAAEKQLKEANEAANDPNMYARAQVMPNFSSFTGKRMMIYFYSPLPNNPPFINSKLSIAFRKGQTEAWRIDASDKQSGGGPELWQLLLDDVGDRATICFVANDKKSGRLREWTQHYKIISSTTRAENVSFIQDGEPAMRLTSGGPCDGVTQVRKEATPVDPAARFAGATGAAPQAPATPLSFEEQMAKSREQAQAMLAEARTAALKTPPPAGSFGHIYGSGSRRGVGNQWQLKIDTQPLRRDSLSEMSVEAIMTDASGKITPLQLANRQLFVNIESRYALVDHLGTKATVCLTATDVAREKRFRLTQHFTIEASNNYAGEQAGFFPAGPGTLTEASNAPCR